MTARSVFSIGHSRCNDAEVPHIQMTPSGRVGRRRDCFEIGPFLSAARRPSQRAGVCAGAIKPPLDAASL